MERSLLDLIDVSFGQPHVLSDFGSRFVFKIALDQDEALSVTQDALHQICDEDMVERYFFHGTLNV